nr:elongation factor family protein [Tanacetum cinerariifolium]
MRREGYELQVGQPQVLFKEDDNGNRLEPVELLVVDVPEETAGKVIELVSMRKGEMTIMEPKGDLQHLEFSIPSRGLIGLRNNVIGEHTRPNDLTVNIQKGKKLTNMRASGTDDNVKIVPKRQFSLEEAMEYIQKDEYLEVTPKSVRMRKILLD